MTKTEYIEFIKKDNKGNYKKRENYIRKNFPNIYDEIISWCGKYDINYINFNDAISYYLTDTTKQNKCIVCGKIIIHNAHHCSRKCMHLDKGVNDKRLNTNLLRYGSKGVLGDKVIYEKFKDSCIASMGVTHPSKCQDIKDKKLSKLLNNYGVDNPTHLQQTKDGIKRKRSCDNDIIVNKMLESKKQKYGDKYKQIIDKCKNTLLEKYSVDTAFKIHKDTYNKAKDASKLFYQNEYNKKIALDKRHLTNLRLYGGDPNHNVDIKNKINHHIIENIKSKTKDTFISYNKGFATLLCGESHEYEISLQLLRYRHASKHKTCTICNPPLFNSISEIQKEIYDFISSYVDCELSNRNIINGEIDIYIPSLKIGFEVNGVYWHSDLHKHKDYHINKTIKCKDSGVKLIHIWEDLWYTKQDIIKKRILNAIGVYEDVIYARKCVCREISKDIAKQFLDSNHIQGFIQSHKYFGLYYNDILVYCISIGKRKIIKQQEIDFELLRSCGLSNIKIIGGFSKLFKFVYNNYKGVYISYADLCWGDGDSYKHIGFEYVNNTKPSYFYWYKNKRYHRYNFVKHKLVNMGYSKNKTEKEIMNDIGALRIWDCGNAIWIKKEKLCL